jgi:glutamyl-tRNA synthetase
LEDIDTPRVLGGAAERISNDLLWLGIDWDEPPVRQSDRYGLYEQAIERLTAAGLVYPCDCSRAEIARAASAPHPGEETVYPGLCRHRDPNRPKRRPPALRVRVPDAEVAYEDEALGRVSQNLSRQVGDFVLRRGDGLFAYQLAVVVDDLAMGITHVVRGADLASSTPRQIWLAQTLGGVPPRYAHVPLVVGRDGARLEKRTPGCTIAALRRAGLTAPDIVGHLARGLGLLAETGPASAAEVVAASAARPLAWPQEPWPIPDAWSGHA